MTKNPENTLRDAAPKSNDNMSSTKHRAKRRAFTPAFWSESQMFLTFRLIYSIVFAQKTR